MHRIALSLIALHVFTAIGLSAGNPKKKAGKSISETSKQEPITITSDRMEMDQKNTTVTYRGHVVTVRGDLTLKSETLRATYDPNGKRLKEVVAEGEVQVSMGDRVATGKRAVYSGENSTITLTGNPVVRQGKSQVSGARIIMFINEDRGVVEGGSQRVKAVIFPEDIEGESKDRGKKGGK
jgi:lipopolysaccharide export system protein LptA